MKIKTDKNWKIWRALLFSLVFLLGASCGAFLIFKNYGRLSPSPAVNSATQNVYLAFVDEVYGKIKENYWKVLSDEELTSLFILATEKLTGQPQALKEKNKEALLEMMGKIIEQIDDGEKKKQLVTQTADIVLANLEPFGRSRLYSQKEETELRDKVENRDPSVDQYAVLEVEKDASLEEIKKVYQEKVAELSPQAEASAEAAQKLAKIQNAFEVLKDEESRQLYDTYGVEPTLSYRLLTPEVFYIRIKKISPTTFAELERVTKKVDQGEALDSLIFDLRGNIGGSVDVLPYLLGPFIGQNNYAYQFLHQGQTIDYQTRVGWLPSLVRYKKVVILVDGQTQSSAEIMAAALKKYNVGILVGEKTRGWGTIEKVFPLETQIDEKEKYSVFLVHSLTLRDDGQPIEGNGVEPVVDISQADWQSQLYRYLPSSSLIEAVAQVLEEK